MSDGRPEYIKDAVETTKDVSGMPSLVERAQKLRAKRDEKEELEGKLKGVNVELDTLSKELAESMAAMGVSNFKVDGVGLVYIQRENRPSIVDQPAFYLHLRSTGQGGMIKETVHNKTLSAWVSDQLKSGKQLPPSLNNYVQPKALIRKR